MALETLKDVKEIGGFLVVQDFHEAQIVERRWEKHILINHDANMITFRLQKGPIKEHGVNGCQIDTIIETAQFMIAGLNKNFPCIENECALHYLEGALQALALRKRVREARGVEGTNNA